MNLTANAKINLGLDITGRRPDGYHEIRTVMQSIRLADTLELEKTEIPGIQFSTNSEEIPADESNLVWKAARMLLDEFAPRQGLRIRLEKRIPAAAGMAGGSTDAAAALRGVNEELGLGLSLEQLAERGARLGADIPFCVIGGTALAEGIGEILTPLPPIASIPILLCKPNVRISTAEAYAELDRTPSLNHPPMEKVVSSIKNGDLEEMAPLLDNVFTRGAAERFPQIREICFIMNTHGALTAQMSGSGPTVFGLFHSKEQADDCARMLRSRYADAFISLTCPALGTEGAAGCFS